MSGSLRPTVDFSQRQPVTGFRDNLNMSRPKDLPSFDHLGARIAYWREKRELSRSQLADRVGLAYSTLSDLEDQRSDSTRALYKFAQALRLSLNYLESDEGDPEADAPPPLDNWPLPGIPRSRLDGLDRTETRAIEAALKEVLAEIEQDRRKKRKTG